LPECASFRRYLAWVMAPSFVISVEYQPHGATQPNPTGLLNQGEQTVRPEWPPIRSADAEGKPTTSALVVNAVEPLCRDSQPGNPAAGAR
jgi:hypothetical protein